MADKKIFPRVKSKDTRNRIKVDDIQISPEIHKEFFVRFGNNNSRGAWYLLLLVFCLVNANLMYNAMDLLRITDGKKTEYEAFKEVYTDPSAIFLLATFVLMGCIIIGVRRVKHDAVDIMLALKEAGVDYNLDSRKVKRAVAIAPMVISNMAAVDREFFEKLMMGDINIKNDNTMRDMAVSIIEGHLQTHPQDAKRVLDVFKEETIPGDLLVRLKQATQSHGK